MSEILVHLTTADVSVVVDLSDNRLPAIVHWGASLGNLSVDDASALARGAVQPVVPNSMDVPVRVSVIPESWTGWTGRPGVEGHRSGVDWSPRFRTSRITLSGVEVNSPYTAGGPGIISAIASDETAGLDIRVDIELTPSGVLRARAEVRNTGQGVYDVGALQLAFPLPARAREVLDFAGRWAKERTPQRTDLVVGIHDREGRRGRTGADAATLLSVGVPGFGFAAGEVWGVHVAFSGNHRHYAERLFSGDQVVGGGELLLPGEMRLESGDSYASPWIYGIYGDGLDDQAQRLHRMLRARPQHPRRPRPVTLNSWEAVYFDHDAERLIDLAERAAGLGVERFVLDDGWFHGRRDDSAGLGDWTVDADVWPEGLGPLADRVRALGMEFGLWFEPEMVNPDSDLAREHPDWILSTGERSPVLSRNQLVLDLGNDEAYRHVRDRIAEVIDSAGVAYIKWDHNRDLVDAGHGPSGGAGVHAQTRATYRMMDELRTRFPELEIESCSSGGARVDLGILEHTDRVWASDCIDPLERQQINRWTMQLLPPELVGSHVASGVSHSTGRSHTLGFRAATSLIGHFGIEWDLATATGAESDELRDWVTLHKKHRALLHSGRAVRVDTADPTLALYGVVAEDQGEALFVLASLARSEVSPRGRFVLRGLNPDRKYHVRPLQLVDHVHGFIPAPWFGARDGSGFEGADLSGRALMTAGLHTPAMFPESAIVFEVTAR